MDPLTNITSREWLDCCALVQLNRYRSITKQFFRRVDGVVIIYDITVEESFQAVQLWLSNIQEAVGDDIPIMVLGNKMDAEHSAKSWVEPPGSSSTSEHTRPEHTHSHSTLAVHYSATNAQQHPWTKCEIEKKGTREGKDTCPGRGHASDWGTE